MKKDKKKQGSLHTFILSLIFAIAIWIMVGVVNNPDINNTMTSLPVRYVGVDELEQKELVLLAPADKATASVTVSGKRSDLIRYSDEVYISVDVSGISSPGEYTLKGITQIHGNHITIVKERLGEVDIVVEKLSEKKIPVEIKQTGSLRSSIIKSEPQLSDITITGAESELEQAKKAVVSVDISSITEDGTVYYEFKPSDESGEILSKATTLTSDTDKIPVDNKVYEKKNLPVKLRLNPAYENNYSIDEEKSSIGVSSVDVGVLSDCEAEYVYVDIDSIAGEAEDFYLIEEEGMYIPRESATIRVKPVIISSTSKYMDITVKAQNLSDGLNADFTETLTGVLVNAPEEILNSADFHFVIDLKDLEKGEHRVPAKISDDRILVSEEFYVDVVIN